MKKKSKFSAYDSTDYLTDEEMVRLFLGEMRVDGTEDEIQDAEDVAQRACARYGLSLAAVGLAAEGAEAHPVSPKSGSKKRVSPQPEPLAAGGVQ